MKQRIHGFTLVEMLGATALAAVLILALLTTITTIRRTQSALVDSTRGTGWPPGLQTSLTWDITHAVQVEGLHETLVIIGYGALDPITLAPMHRLCRITYFVATANEPSRDSHDSAKDANTRWLLRRQELLDDAQAAPWTELLCSDAAAIQLVEKQPPRRVHITVQSTDNHRADFDAWIMPQ